MNYEWAQKHFQIPWGQNVPHCQSWDEHYDEGPRRFDKWLWRLKCWNMNVISDSVRLITINNSYRARAGHCPDKSSPSHLGKHGESTIKCSWHGDRDCREYAGSDLNTHIIPCPDTAATADVPCHIQIEQTEWELHEWHKQWTWTFNKEWSHCDKSWTQYFI